MLLIIKKMFMHSINNNQYSKLSWSIKNLERTYLFNCIDFAFKLKWRAKIKKITYKDLIWKKQEFGAKNQMPSVEKFSLLSFPGERKSFLNSITSPTPEKLNWQPLLTHHLCVKQRQTCKPFMRRSKFKNDIIVLQNLSIL